MIKLTTFLVTVAMLLLAGLQPARAYTGEYVSIYDADTFTMKVWLWPSNSLSTGQYAIESMRLYGVDAPEAGWRAKCEAEKELGAKATSFVYSVLSAQREFTVDVRPTRGARGRPLITVWVGDVSLADILVEYGYAKPYYGRGPQPDWCAGTPV